MASTSPSLRWLYLAVLGPLVLLAVLAWWGSQSQLKAAWTEAREEAKRLAPELAREVSSDFEKVIIKALTYPDPPVPTEGTDADTVLDSENVDALMEVVRNPDAGLSTSGLPRRALAALRIQNIAPGTQARSRLVKLLSIDAPSVLSQPALMKLELSEPELAMWRMMEDARSFAKPLANGESTWITQTRQGLEEDSIGSYVRLSNGVIDYLPSNHIEGVLLTQQYPKHYWLELTHRNAPAAASESALAFAPLSGLGDGLILSINISRNTIEGPIRSQQMWTLYLLAAALLTATISLFIIHRTVARERHLADLKSQFVASVSHELRAPLGSIRLMAEALQQEKVRKPAEFHTLIAKEGARLSHLIENVLDFARIEEGRKHYHFEECDLTALLRDTLRLMQPIAEEREVHLTFDLAEITLTVDPAAIQQALVNLLDNAIKFSPPKGIVKLEVAELPNQSVAITISDHGPGIPAKEHRNIFKRFHRLGNELRRETQGTGIGLSIVAHIAEAHNGTITVASTPPNGSTFTLTLPSNPPVA